MTLEFDSIPDGAERLIEKHLLGVKGGEPIAWPEEHGFVLSIPDGIGRAMRRWMAQTGGSPLEVFACVGKAGSEIRTLTDTVARMVSCTLQGRVDRPIEMSGTTYTVPVMVGGRRGEMYVTVNGTLRTEDLDAGA